MGSESEEEVEQCKTATIGETKPADGLMGRLGEAASPGAVG